MNKFALVAGLPVAFLALSACSTYDSYGYGYGGYGYDSYDPGYSSGC